MNGRLVALAICLVSAAAAIGVQSGRGSGEVQPASHAAVDAVRIFVPGADPVVSGADEAPPAIKSETPPFSYPDDGSAVSVGPTDNDASTDDETPTASGSTDLKQVSLLGGEITADEVVTHVVASLAGGVGSADFTGTDVTNLVVLGQPVTVEPRLAVPVGDWGRLVVLEQGQKPLRGGTAYHASAAALDLWVDVEHGGLPAGTRIVIGAVGVTAAAAPPAAPPPASPPAPTTPTTTDRTAQPARPIGLRRRALPSDNAPNGRSFLPFPILPPSLLPHITAGGHVFPVYGPSSYTDTFQAPRSDVEGGWHHGDDIFAGLGAPVLAVADGTVFSVGPNRVGGNRLWLQDQAGNQYYYAHLSAYTALAVNGAHVHAGAVLGFVGNTGDARGGAYHLHFEIHPAPLLFLGYDGVVDPTPFLDAWQHLRDIRFPAGVAWAPQPLTSNLPTPGAVLLQSTDISTASGLDPRSLEHVLAPTGAEGALLFAGSSK